MNEARTPSILEIGTPIVMTDMIHDLPELIDPVIIGDVHGCLQELVDLLQLMEQKLGGSRELSVNDLASFSRPLLFVGDIVDRGDQSLETLDVVIELCRSGRARVVMGNHDFKFLRWLRGEKITVAHGLEETIGEFQMKSTAEQSRLRQKYIEFYESVPYAIRFDGGKGVVVHAAWRPAMKTEHEPGKVRYYAIYGPTTGGKTAEGFPVRIDWAATYRGPEFAIFGHQVYDEPYVNEHAIGIDTGCVFGGGLTAFDWSHRSLTTTPSRYARLPYRGRVLGRGKRRED